MGRPPGSTNKRKNGGNAYVVPSLDGGKIGSPEITDFDNGSGSEYDDARDAAGTTTSVDGADAGGNSGPASGEPDQYGHYDRGYGKKPDGSWRQRRANGEGSQGRTASQARRKIPLDLKGIEAMLLSMHGMGAMMLKIPELALSEQESAMMAAGIANVAKHYPDTIVSEKTLAWSNLAMVMIGVYGTRTIAIANNRKRERKAKQNPVSNANVFTLQPGIQPG